MSTSTTLEFEYHGPVGVDRVPDDQLPPAIRQALEAIGEEDTRKPLWYDVTPKGFDPTNADTSAEATNEVRRLVRGRRVTTKVVGGRLCIHRWNGGTTK